MYSFIIKSVKYTRMDFKVWNYYVILLQLQKDILLLIYLVKWKDKLILILQS